MLRNLLRQGFIISYSHRGSDPNLAMKDWATGILFSLTVKRKKWLLFLPCQGLDLLKVPTFMMRAKVAFRAHRLGRVDVCEEGCGVSVAHQTGPQVINAVISMDSHAHIAGKH